MNLRSNPLAVAAARDIEARTGFDILDDSQVEQAVALCARQRTRAVRLAVISGSLAAVIVVALAVASVLGRPDLYALALAAVLLVINLARMGRSIWSARRFARIPRSIEAARAGVRAAGAAAPSRGRPQWN